MNFEDYAINVSPLPAEDGGGFMASIPDLPGCIADGATIDEADRRSPGCIQRVDDG